MEWMLKSTMALQEVAESLLVQAGNRKKWLLVGEMGAGKTTLVAAIAQKLKSPDAASSPTFALVNEYALPEKSPWGDCIWHLDLYRLETTQEALNIGIDEYLYDANLTLIEWPDVISNLLPADCFVVYLSLLENHTHRIYTPDFFPTA